MALHIVNHQQRARAGSEVALPFFARIKDDDRRGAGAESFRIF